MKTTTYTSHIFKNVNFNLYGVEDIDFEESKKEILQEFEQQYIEEIKTKLKNVGLGFAKLKWFSPREYNFSGDSIDLEITVIDKEKFKSMVLANKDKINTALSKNKSYDG